MIVAGVLLGLATPKGPQTQELGKGPRSTRTGVGVLRRHSLGTNDDIFNESSETQTWNFLEVRRRTAG